MTPLISVTLAYAGGLLIGLRFGVGPGLLLALLAVLVLALLPSRNRLAVGAVFVVAGAAVGGARGSAARSDCLTTLPDGTTVISTGVPQALATEGVSLSFEAQRIQADSIACGAGVTRLRVQARHLALLDSSARGRIPRVIVRGRWLAFDERNGWPRPPQFAGMLMVQSVVADTTSQERASAGTRFRTAQQARLRAMLPQTWGLAEALLLAQRGGLTPAVQERWVSAGLVHLLAISGMHVALIITGLIFIGGWLGQSRRNATRAALLLATAYVLFLGAPAAALRSLLQAVLLLAGMELQRPAEPFTVLSASALFILLVEPLYLIDPGFQLSFAGIVGLIGWRRPLAALLPGPKFLRDGLASGIAASALTTPIAALHFGTVGWIGIVGTIAATPVMSAAMAALIGGLLLSALTGALPLIGWPAHVLLRALDLIAAACAWVPGGHGQTSPQVVLAVLAGLAVAIVLRRRLLPPASLPPPSHAPDAEHVRWAGRNRLRRLRTGVAASAAIAVVAWSPLVVRPRDGRVEIHAIDVGQGDALAIRTPHGRWLLVDAGPRTLTRDAGRDRVMPYLLRHGVRRLDALILTHPHSDHVGGAAAVMEVLPVDLIVDPGAPLESDVFADLLNAARHGGRRWIAARDGLQFDVDGVSVTLLHPLPVLDEVEDPNDLSVVFRVAYGSFSALFTGDAGGPVEAALLARHRDELRTVLLKVGHHGSHTSTTSAFLEAASPQLALISAGRGNGYGHPAPGIVTRLRASGVRVLRTDELGDITVRAWRDGRTEVLAR